MHMPLDHSLSVCPKCKHNEYTTIKLEAEYVDKGHWYTWKVKHITSLMCQKCGITWEPLGVDYDS